MLNESPSSKTKLSPNTRIRKRPDRIPSLIDVVRVVREVSAWWIDIAGHVET